MPSAKQLPLFSLATAAHVASASDDVESRLLLDVYRRTREAEGAHPRSVAREVSQLRSLARDAGLRGGTPTLMALASDVSLAARLLLDPPRPISRSTGRARLVALQRFARLVSPSLGLDAATQLAELDRLLPAARLPAWHVEGTVVAGEVGRRRRLWPTLDGGDLRRIVEQAGAIEAGAHATRDMALVALACFSGLRPEEITALRWEDLSREPTSAGHYGLMIRLARRGRIVRILVAPTAAAALAALAESFDTMSQPLSGHMFSARGRVGRPLSYRTVRAVLCEACRRAGFPAVEAADLRAAFGWWLKTQGLSDHEVAEVLGFARVRSVDRLLRRHAELHAQRRVREHVDWSS